MQKVTPFLWFNGQAEEAANFYCALFPDSKITAVTHYTEAGKELHNQPVGSVMTVEFEILGQNFTALNAGTEFQFSPATSFMVHCDSQEEVDKYWDALCDGGQPMACGWLTDKFGVTWQITPQVLLDMVTNGDKTRTTKAMQAMMEMVKLDIAKLQEAYDS
jgi:predicted 3-demethylubiquinone-9 3-methyltransferase (glyoxalase superfamily)